MPMTRNDAQPPKLKPFWKLCGVCGKILEADTVDELIEKMTKHTHLIAS